ncbi:unnamed protein product [Caenorhabditis angaria]|uniref:G-protein coupled receptors family 1 profile domain-containing protein n=1 Tax=Caenorhabditis angaria TaxID=860376 RepID=A0A9P1MYT3_9PELO|nr:unnamed protein product [Caenorhabditis angaria]
MGDDVCDVNYTVKNISEYVIGNLGERCQSISIILPTIVIYLAIFLVGLFGNICTCIVIVANKSMHNPTNFYLFSLAVSDIIILVLGLPMELYQSLDFAYPYRFGIEVCKARAFLIEFTSYASIMIICCFSFERWLAICFPLRVKIFSTLWRANVLIVLAWSISFFAALPMAFIVVVNKLPLPNEIFGNETWISDVSADRIHVDRTEYCGMASTKGDEQKKLIYIAFFAFFVIPAILIILMYSHIAVRLNETKLDKSINKHKSLVERRNRSNKTVLKMLFSVVITFFLCWLPFHIQRLLSVYMMNIDPTTSLSPSVQFLSMIVYYISGFCYYSNSAANPILYNILSQKYRKAFCRTILGRKITSVLINRTSNSTFAHRSSYDKMSQKTRHISIRSNISKKASNSPSMV